jgi:rod shape-determining protein MreD
MYLLSRLAPFVSVALLVLLAALPWGLSPEDRMALPLLPVIAIHYWTLRHDALIPEWLVFAFGLMLDILTQGPLGFWSLLYLLGYLLAVLSQPLAGRGAGARLMSLLAALVIVSAAAWLVASAYQMQIAEPRPYLLGAAIAGLATVILLPMLRALDRSQASPLGHGRFQRGM